MAIINFNSISGVSTISVASSITVGNNVAIGTDTITAGSFVGDLSGNVTGTVNSSGIATFTTLNATSITGVSTAGITTAYINTLSGISTISADSSVYINQNLVFPSGKGIDFSATSQAAGMTSELLADYEEGTFTPTISGWSGTYSRQMGVYVKIGKIVYIQGEVITNSGGSHTSGFPGPAGLPFAMENNGASYYGAWTAVATFGSPGATWIGSGPLDYQTGGTSFFPNKYGVNQGTGNLSAAEFGTSGGGMRFFAVYRTA